MSTRPELARGRRLLAALAKFESLNLAGCCFGQSIDDLDPARILPGARAAVMRTALRLGGGVAAIGLAFLVAAPALRAAYVAMVVCGFAAWAWRAMLAPSERESVLIRLRAAIPLMSR